MKIKNKPVFIPGLRSLAEDSPAQRDSGIYKLADGTMGLMGVIGVMGIMGVMGLMGRKHKNKNSPAQRGSGNSISGVLGIL